MALNPSYCPNLYSIDDILATQERTPCEFLVTVPKMGILKELLLISVKTLVAFRKIESRFGGRRFERKNPTGTATVAGIGTDQRSTTGG